MYEFVKMRVEFQPNAWKSFGNMFENQYDMLEYYLSTMWKNGQIERDYNVVRCGDGYDVYCTVFDVGLLEAKHNNKYTDKVYRHMNVDYSVIGVNANYYQDCVCQDSSWYLLSADIDSYDGESPLICGDCGFNVHISQTPYLFGEEEHMTLISYSQLYAAVDVVWVETLSDRYSKNQMTNVNSPLVQRGLEIRQELEDKMKKPVYLFVRNPIGEVGKKAKAEKPLTVCPSCGQKLSPSMNTALCGGMCHSCRIAFN